MSLYASDPAPPVLAHTLLSQPAQQDRDPNVSTDKTHDLKSAIEAGIKCSPDALLRPGVVIGFSRHRRKGTDDDDHEYIGRIPRYLLTNHLRNSSSRRGASTTFIIHPFNSDIFSPQSLLNSLSTKNSNLNEPLSREEAISRLDTVQLLPVYDFPAAMQAITQVSDTIHQISEKHQQLTTQSPIVLIIAGLDTLVEGIIRASNPIKGTAVLNAALRPLTRLSRAYASFLSVLLVNTSGLGLGMSTGTGTDVGVTADDVYQGGGGEQLAVLLPSLLMKTLDQGVDTHLMVSRERGRAGRVGVEVIKDRVGDGLGMRCVWDGL